LAGKAPKSRELIQGLEGLALKVVMLEEGDLPGLGAFLTHLEQLQGSIRKELRTWLCCSSNWRRWGTS
jgi:hypothetical protein